MAVYTCKVEVRLQIDNRYIEEGYNVGDMIQEEIGNALNGTGIEVEDIMDIEVDNG